MKENKNIAIVGAGVAGMALAILAAKQGHKVSLFERGSTVSDMGAGVTLWPNAMFVMQQLGLDHEISRAGGIPDMMCQLDQNGALQTTFDISAVNVLCGFPSVTVLRCKLMSLLARTVDSLGVDIKFNCAIGVEDVRTLGQRFDLVVGADGRMNSVVRQALYKEKITPCYHGFVNVIGVSSRRKSALDNAICDFRGSGQRFGIVPVDNGRCYWAGAWKTPMNTQLQTDWYEALHQRFRDWPDAVQDALLSRDRASVTGVFVHDIDPLPHWHRDNILIIGDAAHASLPTSGQGACQALEDAWHLSRALSTDEGLDTSLQNFYRQRYVKTSAAQTIGRQLADKLFTQQPEPLLPATQISVTELSAFWMQGLA